MSKKKPEDMEPEIAKQPEIPPDDQSAPPAEVVAEPAATESYPVLRVAETWKGSLKEQMVKLKKGKLIDPRRYGGNAGIDGLLAAGVKLERA